jgi:hypothetical protein
MDHRLGPRWAGRTFLSLLLDNGGQGSRAGAGSLLPPLPLRVEQGARWQAASGRRGEGPGANPRLGRLPTAYGEQTKGLKVGGFRVPSNGVHDGGGSWEAVSGGGVLRLVACSRESSFGFGRSSYVGLWYQGEAARAPLGPTAVAAVPRRRPASAHGHGRVKGVETPQLPFYRASRCAHKAGADDLHLRRGSVRRQGAQRCSGGTAASVGWGSTGPLFPN